MWGFMAYVLLYTFAIYGLIIFLKELYLLVSKYKNTCKMVLILEEKNIEEILRDLSWILQDSNMIKNIYVLNKSDSIEASDILQKYCADNEFFVLADEQKIMEIINVEK